jgi:hypothetical protein
LVTNGSGVLSFAGVSASAGQVIQVVTATDSTLRSTTSTSFVTASNTLSVSITPSSASNKVFITCNIGYTRNFSNNVNYFTIYRDSTNLGGSNGLSYGYNGDPSYSGIEFAIGMSILDSPSTTSATTYQVYVKAEASTTRFCGLNTISTITAFEIKG